MTKEEIVLYEKEVENERKFGFARWGAFGWIEKLANGDVTKFDAVAEVNFLRCLNLLSYWKERDDYVAREQKRQQDAQNLK